MKTGPVTATLVLCVLAWGCAPTVWYRPDATQAQLSVDDARCRLITGGANPDTGVATIKTVSFRRDFAANTAAGLLHVVA